MRTFILALSMLLVLFTATPPTHRSFTTLID